MRKLFVILFVFIVFIVNGCSSSDSGDSTITPVIKVNLLGSWDRQVASTGGGICDGLFPQSVETFTQNGTDSTQLGVITIVGEQFDVDSLGNCIIVDTTITNNNWIGRPAEQTASEFLNFAQQDSAGDNTIKLMRLDAFTANKIIAVTEFTNGVVMTFFLDR